MSIQFHDIITDETRDVTQTDFNLLMATASAYCSLRAMLFNAIDQDAIAPKDLAHILDTAELRRIDLLQEHG